MAVAILANDDDAPTGASVATPVAVPAPATPGQRYDGAPEEGTRGIVAAQAPAIRYDGGPEEGTAAQAQRSQTATPDASSTERSAGVRYDGGPEEGRADITTPDVKAGARPDGGPEEGLHLRTKQGND